jgi:hypothetical protein
MLPHPGNCAKVALSEKLRAGLGASSGQLAIVSLRLKLPRSDAELDLAESVYRGRRKSRPASGSWQPRVSILLCSPYSCSSFIDMSFHKFLGPSLDFVLVLYC